MSLKQANDFGTMPAGVAKLDGKTKVVRQLRHKSPKRGFAIARRERWWQLHKDDTQLGRKRLDRIQKTLKLRRAIAQSAPMRDFPRQFARESKMRRRLLNPTHNGGWLRRGVKGGVDLDRGKKTRIPRKPLGVGKTARVKNFAPFLKTPRARTDADFMLMMKIQVTCLRYFSEQNGFNLV